MELRITIELGNDAMQTPADVLAAVERSFRARMDMGAALDPLTRNIIRDDNGNTVGRWIVDDSN